VVRIQYLNIDPVYSISSSNEKEWGQTRFTFFLKIFSAGNFPQAVALQPPEGIFGMKAFSWRSEFKQELFKLPVHILVRNEPVPALQTFFGSDPANMLKIFDKSSFFA